MTAHDRNVVVVRFPTEEDKRNALYDSGESPLSRFGGKIIDHGMTEGYTEYGVLYASGDMLVHADDPELEEIYPTEKKIGNSLRAGRQVFRRTVVVVSDWEQVSDTTLLGGI